MSIPSYEEYQDSYDFDGEGAYHFWKKHPLSADELKDFLKLSPAEEMPVIVFEYAVFQLDTAGENTLYEEVMKLDEFIRKSFMALKLDTMVKNGGFISYFKEQYGDFGFITMAVLEEIKAPQLSLILKKAIHTAFGPAAAEVEKEYRSKQKLFELSKISEKTAAELDAIDAEYIQSAEDILTQLQPFIASVIS